MTKEEVKGEVQLGRGSMVSDVLVSRSTSLGLMFALASIFVSMQWSSLSPALQSLWASAPIMPFSAPIPSTKVMSIWADHSWEAGTTALPISQTSIVAKALLSRQYDQYPPYLQTKLDTIPVTLIRRFLNDGRHERLLHLCPTRDHCDVTTPDPLYGLTPLHMAAIQGDHLSMRYLVDQLGASPDVLDSAQRKPANLTFTSFIRNARVAARKAFRHCEIPEVFLTADTLGASLKEIRRLVHEGEPVAIRGMSQWANSSVEFDLQTFLLKFGDVAVTAGSVPYSSYFGLPTITTTIRDYMAMADNSVYVFDKSADITSGAYGLLKDFVGMALPSYIRVLAQESIHFYLGQSESGAPFHIHSDALNLLVHGRKMWFVSPPDQAVYSRTPIKEFLDSDSHLEMQPEPPLQCEQRPGDLFFVPFDWGHAIINTAPNTFGYALEILNDRDSFSFLR